MGTNRLDTMISNSNTLMARLNCLWGIHNWINWYGDSSIQCVTSEKTEINLMR